MCENVIELNQLIKQMSARHHARHRGGKLNCKKSIISANVSQHVLSADKC